MLNVLGKSAGRKELVARLYAATIARARTPVFFTTFGVPDTIDGRFDLLALHAWLVLDRLRAAGLGDVSQGLTDTIFIGFDEGLRDLGAGDMSIGRRIKQLADAFYGRLQAYGASEGAAVMTEAIQRNLYRGEGATAHAQAIARYVESARAHLGRSDVARGEVDFGPLP
jgi:cytochrome b pre-mRNA-processing protein 3